MLAKLGELAHDDRTRVHPNEYAEENEGIEEEIENRATITRDVAERRSGHRSRTIAQQREQVDGDEGSAQLREAMRTTYSTEFARKRRTALATGDKMDIV